MNQEEKIIKRKERRIQNIYRTIFKTRINKELLIITIDKTDDDVLLI